MGPDDKIKNVRDAKDSWACCFHGLTKPIDASPKRQSWPPGGDDIPEAPKSPLRNTELEVAKPRLIDVSPVKAQAKTAPPKTGSYYSGAYAVGDDVMAGMTVVKVEDDRVYIDFPKPPPKPMMTAQAQFENKMKSMSSEAMGKER